MTLTASPLKVKDELRAMTNSELNREDVLEIAVVALGPDMVAAFGLDELGGDAHPVPGLAHAALDDVIDTQLAPDLADIDRLALEGERRVAGDHEQRAEAREFSNNVLGDAVGEVLLLGVARHVVEGQHGD